MAFSYHNYTGDNSTTTFNIPFTYTDTSELSVTVDGVAETGLTFPSTSTVTLTSAPASGTLVQVRRTTSLTARAVDFASGSVLTEEDLDDSNIQVFHAAQEAVDTAGDAITLDATDRWDAGGKVIKNVGSPVADTDAVNKAFISTNLPNITTVAGINTEVTTVAGNATNITDIQNASANATTATTQAGLASGFADEAEAWAQKIDGEAQTGEGYSSKAWAVGDNGGVSNSAGAGNAKDWATETTTTVDTNEYSAKEYAIGAQRRGQAGGGSAKDWATYVNGEDTVDGTGKSARYWAQKAQDSKTEFSNIYHGESSTAPTGSEVGAGDLWFDSGNNVLKFYNNNNQWVAIEAVDTSSFASTSFSLAMSIAL
jgi:hypothetical protein